jgi:hypothetical protein
MLWFTCFLVKVLSWMNKFQMNFKNHVHYLRWKNLTRSSNFQRWRKIWTSVRLVKPLLQASQQEAAWVAHKFINDLKLIYSIWSSLKNRHCCNHQIPNVKDILETTQLLDFFWILKSSFMLPRKIGKEKKEFPSQ